MEEGEAHIATRSGLPPPPAPPPHPEGELKPQVRFPSLPGVEPHRRARGRLSNGARFGRKERKSRSEIEIVFTSDDSGDEPGNQLNISQKTLSRLRMLIMASLMIAY